MTARISVLRWLGVIALGAFGTWAAEAAITDAPGIPQTRIEVTRRGDLWTADFIFDRPVTAWVLRRSDLTAETRRAGARRAGR